MIKQRKLTKQQQNFVDEYVKDSTRNATECVTRAGYDTKYPEKMATQLLDNTRIMEEINKIRQPAMEKNKVTQDKIINELALVAFNDMKEFAEWKDRNIILKDSNELGDMSRAVSSISETLNNRGDKALKVKLYDKLKALELLGKYFNMFKDSNTNIGELKIVVTLPDDLKE